MLASEHVRLRWRLLDLLMGLPLSMTDDSDMFLLCEPIYMATGSRFSTLGEPRVALDGDPALNGFDMAESGVGNGAVTLGERRVSIALRGVTPPEVIEAGVVS